MSGFSQQYLPPKEMSLIQSNKVNSIFYKDTLYKGSKQFKPLLYNTHDVQIIKFYRDHQFHKIAGNALSITGSLALTAGCYYASGDRANINRTTGWLMAGSGLFIAFAGGYLINASTNDLLLAIYIFNRRYAPHKTSIHLSGTGVGLTVKL